MDHFGPMGMAARTHENCGKTGAGGHKRAIAPEGFGVGLGGGRVFIIGGRKEGGRVLWSVLPLLIHFCQKRKKGNWRGIGKERFGIGIGGGGGLDFGTWARANFPERHVDWIRIDLIHISHRV